MNFKVDLYLSEGCGRCPLGGTSACKVHTWPEELRLLRKIVLDCGLNEELKWSVPCYTYRKSNVLILSAFKEFSALSFFKGALLRDTHGLLKAPGKNSQASRRIHFTSPAEITEMEAIVKTYIQEAVELEKAGRKVVFKQNPEPVPEELVRVLDNNPEFRQAFDTLTPGRQRGYILYFSAPKQSVTRTRRIEKFMPKIMEGKGMHDR